jgi:hypothetical protein
MAMLAHYLTAKMLNIDLQTSTARGAFLYEVSRSRHGGISITVPVLSGFTIVDDLPILSNQDALPLNPSPPGIFRSARERNHNPSTGLRLLQSDSPMCQLVRP